MPKNSPALDALPFEATASLKELGHHLALARLRRHESLRSWAQRMAVSVPTLRKMEAGEPTVSAGIYATALWLIGRANALRELAAPEADRGALERDVRDAERRQRRKAMASNPR